MRKLRLTSLLAVVAAVGLFPTAGPATTQPSGVQHEEVRLDGMRVSGAADGTGHARLTFSSLDDDQPAWSPDASKLVFRGTDRTTAAGDQASGSPSVVFEGCDEMLASTSVSKEDVKPHLPAGFEEQGFEMADDPGTPDRTSLVLSARRCERMTVEGAVRENTIDVHFSVLVKPRDKSVGFVGDPALYPYSVFLFHWVSNNPDFIRWMRRGTGLRAALFVPNMIYDFRPSAGVDSGFFFESPSPTPSPARVTGTKFVPSSPPIQAMEDFWALTPLGIVHFISDVPEAILGLGPTTYTVTATEPGTPYYEMLKPTSPLESQGRRFIADPTASNFSPFIGFDKCVYSPDPKKSFCTGGYEAGPPPSYACPPNDDDDNDGLTDSNELLFFTLVGSPDSDLDGVKDGNDDANGNGRHDEDEDDDDECPDRDEDGDGTDDEDEDDD